MSALKMEVSCQGQLGHFNETRTVAQLSDEKKQQLAKDILALLEDYDEKPNDGTVEFVWHVSFRVGAGPLRKTIPMPVHVKLMIE
jgi:hypothetical protein